jgi:hypothetical protein
VARAIAERERGIAGHEGAPDVDPPEWAPARRHLGVCAECRRAALALEPTLLFAALPAPAVGPDEIASMQEAVAALVRAGRIDGEVGRGRRALGGRLRGVAAAAAVAALALVADPGARPVDPQPGGELAAAVDFAGEDPFAPVYPAVLEELDRPEARVYQIPAEGYSVVMIVDASLDV